MRPRRYALVAITLVTLAASGCAPNPARPSTSTSTSPRTSRLSASLATGFRDGGHDLTDKQLDCFVNILEKSDLKSDTLAKLANGEHLGDGSENDLHGDITGKAIIYW